MKFKCYKTFEKDAIAHGTKVDEAWTADEDYIIKRFWIVEKGGRMLWPSRVYLKVKDKVLTHPYISARLLMPDVAKDLVFDVEFKKGEAFAYTFENLEGAPISIYLKLELWVA